MHSLELSILLYVANTWKFFKSGVYITYKTGNYYDNWWPKFVLSEGQEHEYECCSPMRVNVTFLSRGSDANDENYKLGCRDRYHQLADLLAGLHIC